MFRYLVALIIAIFVTHRGYYNRKYPEAPEETLLESDGGPLHRLAKALSVMALASTVVYWWKPERLRRASLPLPAWMRWAGVALAAGGFALLQWSQNTLGRNWSDRPRLMREQTLVSDGPYRWVRHPIYTAFLMILSAPLLLTANWLVGGAWLGMTAIDIWARVRFEERVLQARFGEQYTQLMARTGRLLPRFRASEGSW